MKKRPFLWITIIYFVLNIFNTYFLTVAHFNRYIIPFNHTILSEITSIIGDFAILGILYLIGIIAFKRPKRIAIYLTSLTFILNIAVIALQYYTKSYKLAFSIFNFSLMKSPTGGFGGNVFLDWLYELFVYYRIVVLIPFIIILVLLIIFRKNFEDIKIKINFQKLFCSFALFVGCSLASYGYYQYSLNKNWGFSTDYAQYGCQYAGAYNYYISEFIFRVDNRPIDEDASVNEKENELSYYNKNKESYINILDNMSYSNRDNQTGILKGKNLFVIQMESTMSFCFNATFNDIEITPNFNELFKNPNCFYFSNAYTTVGIGNTSDAEFAFFTGRYPTGDMTIAWEYAEYDFDIPALTEGFKGYEAYSYNGTNESFYNHNDLHEGLYKITSFRGLESFEELYPKKTNKDKYLNYWISDSSILNWALETQKSVNANNKNTISFVETITPHNPFYDMSSMLPNFENYEYGIGATYYQLTNYINQVKYNDKLICDFIKDASNPESPNYLKDTVFILYGDHGNALYQGAYESLYKRDLTELEYRRLLLNIPIIIYDTTGEINKSIPSENRANILGQVKSNTDMYRTILNLFGIEADSEYYGVNMFSGEPSFSYDPKNLDIITDDFIYCKKNGEYELFNGNSIDLEVVEKILDFRKKQDSHLNTLVYTADKKIR